jgi:hypothetical protein
MSSVIIAGDTSGSVTLQAPATAGSTVINLPSTLGSAGTSSFVTSDSSGNIGIGTSSPSQKLNVSGAATTNPSILLSEVSGSSLQMISGASDSFIGTTGSTPLRLGTAFTERMRIDTSGNLGLGVTPSAWLSGYKSFQVGTVSSLTNYSSNTNLSNNWYSDTGAVDRYLTSNYATVYQQTAGQHKWFIAPSGTAGNAITFTQSMTLDASGALLLGTTSSSGAGITLAESSYYWTKYTGYSGWRFGQYLSNLYWHNGSDRMVLTDTGNLTISGATATKASGTTWANPSDIRLKDNVQDYAKGTTELMQIRVRTWNYNGKGGTQEGMEGLGVLADEAMLVLPNTVDTYQAKLNLDDEQETAIKRFDATEITWLLVKTCQEQQAIITQLQADVAALKGQA